MSLADRLAKAQSKDRIAEIRIRVQERLVEVLGPRLYDASLSDTELEAALREAKQDLWQARFALSTRQLKDYSTIPQTRRTIARILTVQRERKLGQTA